MLSELRELWKFRELLVSMVQRELRVRYKGSVLGFLWSFINPLVTTAVMWVVFGKLLHNRIDNYAAYILAALLPFTFFQTSVLDASQSVLNSLPIIKKTYFPQAILPIASVISNFIHLLMGLGVFFVFLLVIYLRDPRVLPFQVSTVYLPILLLLSLLMATGLSLLVSALNTLYEDVKYLVNVAMYMLFYLCPIIYFYEQVSNSDLNRSTNFLAFKLYCLNPMAILVTAYRKSLLAPPTKIYMSDGRVSDSIPLPWWALPYVTLFSILLFLLGWTVFHRLKWKFVERP